MRKLQPFLRYFQPLKNVEHKLPTLWELFMTQSKRQQANDRLSLDLMHDLADISELYFKKLEAGIRNGTNQGTLLNIFQEKNTHCYLIVGKYQKLRETLNAQIFEGEEND